MFLFKIRREGIETERFLGKIKEAHLEEILNKYGEAGVRILSSSTPVETGKTSQSWGYEIEKSDGGYTIYWTNDNINDGVNIAIILQYGHGTGTGGYVQGRDYINPAAAEIFDQIAEEAWKEVSNG